MQNKVNVYKGGMLLFSDYGPVIVIMGNIWEKQLLHYCQEPGGH